MLGRTGYTGVNGGSRAARFARASSIAVGDNTLSNVVVAVSGRDPGEHGTLDGILGYDLLAGALVHVDLVKEIIEFGDPSHLMATVPKNGFAFPVNLADGTPEITLTAGGTSTREIALAPFRYQIAPTCFGSERVFGRDGGLIGFDFLRHFDWTFDYSRAHVILAPNGR